MKQEQYAEFVRSRAKLAPPGHPEVNILHAAVGMIGEAVEAAYAMERVLLVKELGDFEFYFEFYRQWVPGADTCNTEDFVWDATGIPQAFDILIASAADVLNLAKKAWAYETPIDSLDFCSHIPILRNALDALYEYLGIDREQVLLVNYTKLMKRYPDGYSDHAARARADGERDAR